MSNGLVKLLAVTAVIGFMTGVSGTGMACEWSAGKTASTTSEDTVAQTPMPTKPATDASNGG